MYTKSRVPSITSVEDLLKYVEEEFSRVEQAFTETTALDLRPIFAEPQRVRDGLIVYADGISWDPGSGEGVYAYEGGAWVKL